MPHEGFIEDGKRFGELFVRRGPNKHIETLKQAIREVRDQYKSNPEDKDSFAAIEPRLRSYAHLLGLALKAGDSNNPINVHLSNWQRKKHHKAFPIYLLWLAAEHPDKAKLVYQAANLPPRAYSGDRPEQGEIAVPVRGPSKYLSIFTVETNAISRMIREAAEAALDLSGHRRLYLTGAVSLALLVIATSLIVDIRQSRRADDHAAAMQPDRLISANERVSDFALQSQVDFYQMDARNPHLSLARRAESLAQSSLLAAFISRSDARRLLVEAEPLAPASAAALMRVSILQAQAGYLDELQETFATLDRMGQRSPSSEIRTFQQLRWVIAPQTDSQMEYPGAEEVWAASMSLEDPFIRNSILVLAASRYIDDRSEFTLAHRFFQVSQGCSDVSHPIFAIMCLQLGAALQRQAGAPTEADALLAEAAALARNIGAQPTATLLEIHRAWQIYFRLENPASALASMEAQIQPARSTGDTDLLVEVLSACIRMSYYSPISDPGRAYRHVQSLLKAVDYAPNSEQLANPALLFDLANLEHSFGDQELAFQLVSNAIQLFETADPLNEYSLAYAHHLKARIAMFLGNSEVANESIAIASLRYVQYAENPVLPGAGTNERQPTEREVDELRRSIARSIGGSQGYFDVAERIQIIRLERLSQIRNDFDWIDDSLFLQLETDRIENWTGWMEAVETDPRIQRELTYRMAAAADYLRSGRSINPSALSRYSEVLIRAERTMGNIEAAQALFVTELNRRLEILAAEAGIAPEAIYGTLSPTEALRLYEGEFDSSLEIPLLSLERLEPIITQNWSMISGEMDAPILQLVRYVIAMRVPREGHDFVTNYILSATCSNASTYFDLSETELLLESATIELCFVANERLITQFRDAGSFDPMTFRDILSRSARLAALNDNPLVALDRIQEIELIASSAGTTCQWCSPFRQQVLDNADWDPSNL